MWAIYVPQRGCDESIIFVKFLKCCFPHYLWPYVLGWVDIGTGTPVGAVVIHNGKKIFFYCFLNFWGGFPLRICKRIHRKCVRIVSFLKVVFFVCPALLRSQCCQVAEIPAKKVKKWADNKSVLEEFKAEFYQKWRKGTRKILKRCFLFYSCILAGKQFRDLVTQPLPH